jgi:hypothetical protein
MAKFNPFVLSLSKDAYRREAWFDKLTTNGNTVKFSSNRLSTSLETNGEI